MCAPYDSINLLFTFSRLLNRNNVDFILRVREDIRCWFEEHIRLRVLSEFEKRDERFIKGERKIKCVGG